MRLYLSPELIARQNSICLPSDKARHVALVMRLKSGDQLTVFDGMGNEFSASITSVSSKAVVIDIISAAMAEPESATPFILCQGILKGEKMDLVVQKATELGVSGIYPLITERVVVRETRKTGRWRKIAEEAAEQCGRSTIPLLHEPVRLGECIQAAEQRGIIFWECGGAEPDRLFSQISQRQKGVSLFIGPEGGFSEQEVEAAAAGGIMTATLGRRILKAETAALAALAIMQFVSEQQAAEASRP